MNTLFATIEQAENLVGETILVFCDCGETYAVLVDDDMVVACDSCYDHSPLKDRL